MKKSFFSVPLLCLLLPLLFMTGSELFLITPSNEAGTSTVSVFPSSTTANMGQNFSINVNVTGVSDPYGLYAWEFKLNWTASILSVVNVTEGPFLKSGGQTFFIDSLNATAGHIRVDCTLEGNVTGVNGSGVLATIKFNAESPGQSPLNLYNGTLLNSQDPAEPISCQLSSGKVHILSPPDIAVTNVSVSPITVLPGTPVHVNATVQNLGGSVETFNVTTYANSHVIDVQKVTLNSGSSQTLHFTWNTAGYSQGEYNVSAMASTVPGETNTTNNVKSAANIVTILYDGHDIAVTHVDTAKDSDRTVIGQGFSTNITVTIKNYGTYTESFNTTVYLNTSALNTQKVTLVSGASTTINSTWNTTNFAYGNYTINANVALIPSETNNWIGPFTYGTVKVTVPGDVIGNGGPINILDYSIVAINWGTHVPPAPANADIYDDGIINILDIGIVAAQWGQEA